MYEENIQKIKPFYYDCNKLLKDITIFILNDIIYKLKCFNVLTFKN